MARRNESLRAEARRRAITVYQVRKERGEAVGVKPRAAVGHGKPGDLTLKQGRALKAMVRREATEDQRESARRTWAGYTPVEKQNFWEANGRFEASIWADLEGSDDDGAVQVGNNDV